MLLITLATNAHDCQVELDGQDISKRLHGLELEAHVGSLTRIRLFLIDEVTIIGEAGKLEFVKREDHD